MEDLKNPHAIGDQLHTDFGLVSAAQLHPGRSDAAKALLGRAGCLGDALAYYQGVDPTHEVDNAYFDALSMPEQYDEMLRRAVTGLHAAEILVASVVHPGLYNQRHSRRVRLLSKDATWYQIQPKQNRKMITPYDTIGEALDEINGRELTTSEAKTLSMGAEMLSYALTWLQISQLKIYKADKAGYAKDEHLRTVYRSSEKAMLVSVLAVQNMIQEKMLDETSPNTQPEEHLERVTIGLKAQWRSSAILLHPIFRSEVPEQVTETLTGMISSLRREFIDGDLLDSSKYPKSEIKGLLHELLWLLDAHMFIQANPDDYRTVHISPSASRLDRPIINRPAYLRGTDYGIADVDIGGETQLINLKSGNGDSRAYHPRIKPLKEENFIDNARGRLTNKLRFYQQIIDSGFSMPDARKIVEKYALKTVQQELVLHKRPSSEGWPHALPPAR